MNAKEKAARCPNEGCAGSLHVKAARIEPASWVCDECLSEFPDKSRREGGMLVDSRALFLIGTGMQAAADEMAWWVSEPFPADAEAVAAKAAALMEAFADAMRQALGAGEREWRAQAERQVPFNPLVADGIRASDVLAAKRRAEPGEEL